MRYRALGLMSLLILALPSSAFADFSGIVYNPSEEFSKSQLDVDSQILSNITDTVKLYDNPYMEQTVLEFSQKGIDVYIGINILDEYQSKLDNYVGIAQNYSNVLGIVLESDPIDHMPESQIIEIIDYVREHGIQVSVASTPENWNKMNNVLDHVDFVYYYMFDYWNGFSASQSLTKLDLFHKMNLKQYDQQSVYEMGYPDTGNVLGTADPSPSEQKLFFDGLSKFEGNYILFSFTDETEKDFKFGFSENIAERHFGLFNDNKIKYKLNAITKQKEIHVTDQLISGTSIIEYVPTLIQDKSKSESMHEVMGMDIVSKQGSIDVYYDNNQKHFKIVESFTVFLDLDNYEDVEIISDSIDSISFFSIPRALAQCDLDSSTCAYIDKTSYYDYLEYVISASLIGIFTLYITMKFKLFSNLKFRKTNVGNNDENEYFERMIVP